MIYQEFSGIFDFVGAARCLHRRVETVLDLYYDDWSDVVALCVFEEASMCVLYF